MVTGESMEQLAWPSLWRAASQSQHFMLYNWSIFPAQIIFFTKMFHSNISFKSSELRKYSKQISLPSLLSCKKIFTIFISSKAANYSRPCCSCFLKAAKRSNPNIIYISSELRLPYSTKASPKFNFNFFHLTSPKIFKQNIQPKYSTKNIQPKYLIQNHKLFPSYVSWVPLKYETQLLNLNTSPKIFHPKYSTKIFHPKYSTQNIPPTKHPKLFFQLGPWARLTHQQRRGASALWARALIFTNWAIRSQTAHQFPTVFLRFSTVSLLV